MEHKRPEYEETPRMAEFRRRKEKEIKRRRRNKRMTKIVLVIVVIWALIAVAAAAFHVTNGFGILKAKSLPYLRLRKQRMQLNKMNSRHLQSKI